MLAADIPERVAVRARERVTIDGATGCHVSTYSVGSHGYAQIGWSMNGKVKMSLVHRVMWMTEMGDIPEGMVVDHTCKNRRCCNIDHLRLLTNYENARRTNGRDWPLGECSQGHPNEYLQVVDGGRHIKCGICTAEWRRKYNAKRRARRKS